MPYESKFRSTRFRVSDITVVAGTKPKGCIVVDPPHLVVAVLSPDELEEKIADYFAFGIPFVWVINPRTRRGHVYTPTGMHEAKDGVLRATNPDIEVPLAAVFSA